MIYLIEGKKLVVLVVSVGDRKDVYANLAVLVSRVKRWRQVRA